MTQMVLIGQILRCLSSLGNSALLRAELRNKGRFKLLFSLLFLDITL